MAIKVSAIIPAAGHGSRMLLPVPKQFLELCDRPMISYPLEAFESIEEIVEILIAVPKGEEERCWKEWVEPFKFNKSIRIITGGANRQDSVYAGLKAVSGEPEMVVVHDGVRPLVTPGMIRQTLELGMKHRAAVVAIPLKDTIKSIRSDHTIKETIDRSFLWSAQTPQTFSYKLLMEAYERAYQEGVSGTDESSLVERLGVSVHIVPGSWENIKVTERSDLRLAEFILRSRQAQSKTNEKDSRDEG